MAVPCGTQGHGWLWVPYASVESVLIVVIPTAMVPSLLVMVAVVVSGTEAMAVTEMQVNLGTAAGAVLPHGMENHQASTGRRAVMVARPETETRPGTATAHRVGVARGRKAVTVRKARKAATGRRPARDHWAAMLKIPAAASMAVLKHLHRPLLSLPRHRPQHLLPKSQESSHLLGPLLRPPNLKLVIGQSRPP